MSFHKKAGNFLSSCMGLASQEEICIVEIVVTLYILYILLVFI